MRLFMSMWAHSPLPGSRTAWEEESIAALGTTVGATTSSELCAWVLRRSPSFYCFIAGAEAYVSCLILLSNWSSQLETMPWVCVCLCIGFIVWDNREKSLSGHVHWTLLALCPTFVYVFSIILTCLRELTTDFRMTFFIFQLPLHFRMQINTF